MADYPNIIRKPLTREQVRQIDQDAMAEFAMSGLVLMENAGRGAVDMIVDRCELGSVRAHRAAILCGGGNNAGDGYVIARHLQLLGWNVRVLQLSPPGRLRGDALVNWTICQQADVEMLVVEASVERDVRQLLVDCDVIVDCMLGTGASGNPRSPLAEAVMAANDADALRIAIDVPTGLDCETGSVGNPCFQADLTCTFAAPKIGFAETGAQEVLGDVRVVSIGVPRKLLDRYSE